MGVENVLTCFYLKTEWKRLISNLNLSTLEGKWLTVHFRRNVAQSMSRSWVMHLTTMRGPLQPQKYHSRHRQNVHNFSKEMSLYLGVEIAPDWKGRKCNHFCNTVLAVCPEPVHAVV